MRKNEACEKHRLSKSMEVKFALGVRKFIDYIGSDNDRYLQGLKEDEPENGHRANTENMPLPLLAGLSMLFMGIDLPKTCSSCGEIAGDDEFVLGAMYAKSLFLAKSILIKHTIAVIRHVATSVAGKNGGMWVPESALLEKCFNEEEFRDLVLHKGEDTAFFDKDWLLGMTVNLMSAYKIEAGIRIGMRRIDSPLLRKVCEEAGNRCIHDALEYGECFLLELDEGEDEEAEILMSSLIAAFVGGEDDLDALQKQVSTVQVEVVEEEKSAGGSFFSVQNYSGYKH